MYSKGGCKMAVKCFENAKYMKVDSKNKKLRPEIKKKVDNLEELTKEEYETMTYGDWFYIWNGYSIESYLSGNITEVYGEKVDPKTMKGHYVIA